MRLLLAPSLALLATWSWSAEPAPVAELQLANGSELVAHWKATPWGATWADPALAPLRASFDDWEAKVSVSLGETPTELLLAITDAGAVFMPGAVPNRPILLANANFGTFAQKLYDLRRAESSSAKDATIPGADQAFSETNDGITTSCARFGKQLAVGLNDEAKSAAPRSTPPAADVVAKFDLLPLLDLIAGAFPNRAEVADAIADAKAQLSGPGTGQASYRMRMVPEGFHEQLTVDLQSLEGYLPVDRTVLARLPATTLMAAGLGFDGAAYWRQNRVQLLRSMAKNLGTDASDTEGTEQALDTALAKTGFEVKVADLISGWVGTSIIAISPGMPFPAITLVAPRSKALDQLLEKALPLIGGAAPAEGESTALSIPNVPVPLTAVRDPKLWIFSSDLSAAAQWQSGVANGWAATPAAKLALSKAPADAYLIGASDTPAVLRLIAGYAGMALGLAKGLPAAKQQAVLQGLNLLATKSAPGYIVAGSMAGKQVTECRSLTGFLPGFGIIGGAAAGATLFRGLKQVAPAAPRARPAADGPAYILRSQIFPAQVQFQAGTYIDQDADGIGEYALLSELAGRRTVGGKTLGLLSGPLAKSATFDGYAYAIYLPAGETRVAEDGKKDDRATEKGNADAQEEAFIAYAWPVRSKEGRMYALLADGTVHSAPYTGTAPAWNTVFDGKGWKDAVTWDEDADSRGSEAPEMETVDPHPAPVEVLP
jgi:hypothetical protein